MLASSKIVHESPNVIDLGDMPPSRPSRAAREPVAAAEPARHTGGHRPNYTDQEDHRALFRSYNTRRIPLNYSMEADEEPNPQCADSDDDYDDDDDLDPAMDDPECGATRLDRKRQQSFQTNSYNKNPNVEKTRAFAASMIADAERIECSRSILGGGRRSKTGMAWPRRGRRSEYQGLRKAVGMEEEDRLQNLHSRDGVFRNELQDRTMCYRLIAGLSIFCLFLGMVVLLIRSFERNQIYSMPGIDSPRLEATIDVLTTSGISSKLQLQDARSPQYQAARWIATEDSLGLEIPTNLDGNPYEFVQRYVLATFYYALSGSDWINSLRFLSGTHECGWFESVPDSSGEEFAVGVACDENLQVRSILMPSNNAKGRIPEEISQLSKLDFLSLKHNELTGEIPDSLKQLTLLEYLDFKYNKLTGTIPDFLGDLGRLEVLGLSNNQLEGTLPGALGSLGLKTLAIDDNILTGSVAPVAMMTTLEFLYAENNNFNGKLDDGLLTDLTNLIEVDLSGNMLEASSLPPHLFTHPKLRVLDLQDNLLAGSIPSDIPENTAMEFLSLRSNNIPSSIPGALRRLSALTHLDLEANALTGTIPAEELGTMTNLSYLFLGKNPIEPGAIPDQFGSLRSLRELSLDALQLTGPIPTWLENLSGLKLLDLRLNSLAGSIEVDFSKLPQLSYLLLDGNLLDGEIPQSLGSLNELFVVSFHQNGFTGEAGGLCSVESKVEVLTMDCGVITCPCCDDCCDGEGCYPDIIWDALKNSQGTWEEDFRRSNYSFNPHILFDKTSKGPN